MAIGGNDGKQFYSLSQVKVCFIFSLNISLSHNLCILLGKRPLADVWALDTAAKPYEWRKLEPEGEGPPTCM